ncbi:MAG: hypothetical protein IT516_16250 [Burkholderiales bacterium]|nr:hypothetical protein [Burkholderiales bacterium]
MPCLTRCRCSLWRAALVLMMLGALGLPVQSLAADALAEATAGLWSETSVTAPGLAARAILPARFRMATLDAARFHALSAHARAEADIPVRASEVIVPVPLPDGGVARFRIVRAAVMAPALAARYPEIVTWMGEDIADPSTTIRLDWTPLGFHAMLLSPTRGRIFVDPAKVGDTQSYLVYYARDRAVPDAMRMQPLPPVDPGGATRARLEQRIAAREAAPKASGTQTRTYRLAVATTPEYTAFFGGTVSAGLAAVVTAVNRIDGIYAQEIAIRLELVADNDRVIYTSGGPYTNNDGAAMLAQNQANLNAVIGAANYDIGHVFSTGGGGIAGLGVACSPSRKAWGVTGSPAPVGDAFHVDYVAHEMGHQLGANHTFNGNAGSCGGGNRNPATAFEPGSGSTIMAYAGICLAQDLQAHSDAYFHTASFDEIVAYTTDDDGASCGTVTPTGNHPPSVTVPASGATLPSRTPFALMGSGSDADGDTLTYNWEEYDAGATPGGPPGVAAAAPFFRSWPASTGPVRIFPRLSDLLAGTLAPGEVLPNATRPVRFRLTARDGRGGVDRAQVNLLVTSLAGPFLVTAPATPVTWPGASTQTVAWNVANTARAPVNCPNVDILLSTDGGLTFPTLLASATPNDGAEPITVPPNGTASARIMVACSTSPFFNVSKTNFAIATAVPTSATIIANPYGPPSVAGATLTGVTLTDFGTDAVITLGSVPGTPGSFAEIDFDRLNLGAGATLTIRAGAPGQAVVLRHVGTGGTRIDGTLRALAADGTALPLRVANPNGITVAVTGVVQARAGLEVDTLGTQPLTGGSVVNDGTIDGGTTLVVAAAGIHGSGAFKGDAVRLTTHGNANNPVHGSDYLANGLQLFPGTGHDVAVTLNAYGAAPQVLNVTINGDASVWMPSTWPAGSTLPRNNNPLAPDAIRPPGVPEPAYGGGSMIVQATGALTLADGGTGDFVFPGAIVLRATGTLDVNGILLNQGWTGDGQSFQGIFIESPDIVSPAGTMRFFTNDPNWVNFSALPKAPVRAFTLRTQPDGSASFAAADDAVPHLNTYSVIQGIAAAGGCWLCAVNTQPIDVYGP